MINRKEKLFLLVKSLTRNEKGYFKKYASFHTIGKVNNYVLLFDTICSRDVYDEKEVKQILAEKIHPENFREAKSYLYEMILKSLDIFHSNSSVKSILKRQLRSMEILFNKALYDQCKTILDKVERMAFDFDMLDVLVEIQQWRLQIMLKESFKGIDSKNLKDLQEKEMAFHKKVQKTAQYRYLNASLFYNLRKTGLIRNKEEALRAYGDIMEDPLFQNEDEADSIQSKLFLFSALGAYSFIAKEPETSLIYYSKLLEVFGGNPKLIEENFNNYFNGLFNLSLAYMQLGRYDDAMLMVYKLEETRTKSEIQEVNKFVFVHSRKLKIFLARVQLKEALALIPDIMQGIQKFPDKINMAYIYSFNFNIACIYFVSGDYKNSLSWINKIINQPVLNGAIDIQSFARIVNLIIHYELKNTDHLPYIIRSTYRFIMKKERLFEFENLLIKYMNTLQGNIDETELKALFVEFRNDCVLLSLDSFEKAVFDYFDFISWAESKIENRPLLDILKEKKLSS